MAQEYPDKRVREEMDDSEPDSKSTPYGVSRRYWGDTPPKAAPLPHWTDPPTGEIPKIYGLAETDRRAPHALARNEADEGAVSFQRERRRLEYDDKLGTFDENEDQAEGRHFAAEDAPEPLEDYRPRTEEIAVPAESGAGVRVISSRPSPQSMRRMASRRTVRAPAESSEPSARARQDVNLDLPERRRPSFKRKPPANAQGPEDDRSEPATRRPTKPRREGGRSGGSFAT
nr:hypothetical protein [Actinomycetota bacterium]